MSKKVKQISYLSAIVMTVGSTVGAGIFFKNGSIFSNVNGSLGLMITSWLVAAIGVMALALALVEMSSASKTDGGILEWARRFLPKRASKMSAAYMLLVYLPLNYLAMPLYVVMSLQDAIQSLDADIVFNGGITALMALGLFMFSACFDWVGHKYSKKMQIGISWIKFIPLAIVIGFSIYVAAHNGSVATHIDSLKDQAYGLTGFAPALGILASIPAILFAYDGFYTVTSLRSELKDEKKMGPIVAVAISLITAMYLVFGIVTGMTGEKDFFGIMGDHKWFLLITNSLIMIAVFAILNAFALATYRIYEATYSEQPIGIVGLVGKMFKMTNHHMAAWWTSVFMTILYYIVLIPVGIMGFSDGGYDYYGEGSGNLYNMADMLTNYTSLMAFAIIAGSVAGALWNRKTNAIKVDKKWYFMPAAIIAIIFTVVAVVYMVSDNIAGMAGANMDHVFTVASMDSANSDILDQANDLIEKGTLTDAGKDAWIASHIADYVKTDLATDVATAKSSAINTEITKFVILIVTLAISAVPAFIPQTVINKLSVKHQFAN